MRTREPADKHYGENRPLGPGVHVERAGYARAAAGTFTEGRRNDPAAMTINPLNWAGYEADANENRAYASPYGDTTVVQPKEGLTITRAQQRVIPQLGLNSAIGATDSRADKERPNLKPLGMSTGLKLGGGPQRNVPKAEAS